MLTYDTDGSSRVIQTETMKTQASRRTFPAASADPSPAACTRRAGRGGERRDFYREKRETDAPGWLVQAFLSFFAAEWSAQNQVP